MFQPIRRVRRGRALRVAAALGLLAGCRGAHSRVGGTAQHSARSMRGPHVRDVICLFDQKPWINADAAGDLDPEGIQFRVFLDMGEGRGVQREGKFHIELYQVGGGEDKKQERILASDWHYPTSQFSRVSARILGLGYHIKLRWAKKGIAGNEVEIVTQFEDIDGTITRGATKRLRVPKYTPYSK